MDIHLTDTHGGHVRLFVEDVLAGELSVGQFDGRDTLEARSTAANCLRALAALLPNLGNAAQKAADCPDHVYTTPERRQAAYLRGLSDGLARRVRPHPLPGVPPVPPEASRVYDLGYGAGSSLADVMLAYQHAREAC